MRLQEASEMEKTGMSPKNSYDFNPKKLKKKKKVISKLWTEEEHDIWAKMIKEGKTYHEMSLAIKTRSECSCKLWRHFINTFGKCQEGYQLDEDLLECLKLKAIVRKWTIEEHEKFMELIYQGKSVQEISDAIKTKT